MCCMQCADKSVRATRSKNRSRYRGFRAGFHDQTAPAKYAAALRFLQRFRGGDRAENVKQPGVCRDLQIEIEKAVYQDSHTSKESGHGYRAARGLGPIIELVCGLAEHQHQKPDRDGEASQAGFDEQLQIIVVRVVHEEGGVKTAKFRVDNGKGAESPTEDGPLDQHAQTVTIDA